MRQASILMSVWFTISKEHALFFGEHLMWEYQNLIPSCMRVVCWFMRLPQNPQKPKEGVVGGDGTEKN